MAARNLPSGASSAAAALRGVTSADGKVEEHAQSSTALIVTQSRARQHFWRHPPIA
jgi:hypothetical protein